MRGMGRLFQGAATVDSILRGDLIERAAEAGLRSLFVGFETLTPGNLARSNKRQNLGRDYTAVTDRLHDLGIMINGSFVFGMDDDDEDVFRADGGLGDRARHHDRDVPHPDAVSRHARCSRGWQQQGRITTRNWDLYDTRHVVYRPARLTPEALEGGLRLGVSRVLPLVVDRARRRASHGTVKHQAKHFFYAAGWKKFEPLWDLVIRARQLRRDDAGARGGAVEGDFTGPSHARPAARHE